MRGYLISHKFNVARVIHHVFYPKGSTMVNDPWFYFRDRTRHKFNRNNLAIVVRQLRKSGKLRKGWVVLDYPGRPVYIETPKHPMGFYNG